MITGYIQTKAGEIPAVSTRLDFRDYLGAVKVRWGIGRNKYRVKPGIYAVGKPGDLSDVFVTANYKLSFDHLRKNLDGLDAWILVLDTKGINVWCAAGKGTFGTGELVHRIQKSGLDLLISHRKLILPQLGVSAYQVKKATEPAQSMILQAAGKVQTGKELSGTGIKITSHKGYHVIYGPVKASDISNFVKAGYKATPEMRKVSFDLKDRARLIPVDLVYGKYLLLAAMALVFILSGLSRSGLSIIHSYKTGFSAMTNVVLAYAAGIVMTPLFLPYLPGRAFALKGFFAGSLIFALLLLFHKTGNNLFESISWFLIIAGIASFMAMNFTGSSTFTSLSGVKKEMKFAIPLQVAFAVSGLTLFVISKIII